MFYLVVETAIILFVTAAAFFTLGGYYQRRFGAQTHDEKEEATGSWDLKSATVVQAAPVDFGPLLARLDALEDGLHERPAPMVVAAPTDERVIAALHAIEQRLTIIELGARDTESSASQPAFAHASVDLGPVLSRMDVLEDAVRARPTPVVVAAPPDEGVLATLHAIEQRLKMTEGAAATSEPMWHPTPHVSTDLTPIVDRLARIEETLAHRPDEVTQYPPPPGIDPRFSERLGGIEETLGRLIRHADEVPTVNPQYPVAPTIDPAIYQRLGSIEVSLDRLVNRDENTPPFGTMVMRAPAELDEPLVGGLLPSESGARDGISARLSGIEDNLAQLASALAEERARDASPSNDAASAPWGALEYRLTALEGAVTGFSTSLQRERVTEEIDPNAAALAGAFRSLELSLRGDLQGLEDRLSVRETTGSVFASDEEIMGRMVARLDSIEARLVLAETLEKKPTRPTVEPAIVRSFAMEDEMRSLEDRLAGRVRETVEALMPKIGAHHESSLSLHHETKEQVRVSDEKINALGASVQETIEAVRALEEQLAARFQDAMAHLAFRSEPKDTTENTTHDDLVELDQSVRETVESVRTLEQRLAERFQDAMSELADKTFRDNAEGTEPSVMLAATDAAGPTIVSCFAALEDALRAIEGRLAARVSEATQELRARAAAEQPTSMENASRFTTLEERITALDGRVRDSIEGLREDIQSRLTTLTEATPAAPTVSWMPAAPTSVANPRVDALESAMRQLRLERDAERIRANELAAQLHARSPESKNPELEALEHALQNSRVELAAERRRANELAAQASKPAVASGPTEEQVSMTTRMAELEARVADEEERFEQREAALDREYQERIVSLEKELESLENRIAREERDAPRWNGTEAREHAVEERSRRLEERERAFEERIAAVEALTHREEPRDDSRLRELEEELRATKKSLERADERKLWEEEAQAVDRRFQERFRELERETRSVREDVAALATSLHREPVAQVQTHPDVAEVLHRLDGFEARLRESIENRPAAEVVRMVEPRQVEIRQLEVPATRSSETSPETALQLQRIATEQQRLVTEIATIKESLSAWEQRSDRRFDDESRRAQDERRDSERRNDEARNEMERRIGDLASHLEADRSTRDHAQRELSERIEQFFRRTPELVDGLLDRERTELQRQLTTHFEKETAMADRKDLEERLNERIRQLERELSKGQTVAAPSPLTAGGGLGALQAQAEREAMMRQIREAEDRARDRVHALEQQLERSRAEKERAVAAARAHADGGHHRGGGGFSSEVIEALETRVRLLEDAGDGSGLREEFERRFRDLESRDREKSLSTEFASERARLENFQMVTELRNEFRRELETKTRDLDDRMFRMQSSGGAVVMGGGSSFDSGHMTQWTTEWDRRLQDALAQLRMSSSTDHSREEKMREELHTLSARVDEVAAQDVSGPVNEALRSFRQRIEKLEQELLETAKASSDQSSIDEKVNELLAAREREQAAGLAADIDDLRRSLAQERIAMEKRFGERFDKLGQQLAEIPQQDGGGDEWRDAFNAFKSEQGETLGLMDRQLQSLRESLLSVDKRQEPLAERLEQVEKKVAQAAARDVSSEMGEALGGFRGAIDGMSNQLRSLEEALGATREEMEGRFSELRARYEDKVEDLVTHIDHLQDEMRDEAVERENGSSEKSDLFGDPISDLEQKFARLEKSFGSEVADVRTGIQQAKSEAEHFTQDETQRLEKLTAERLQSMVSGLEKLLGEKQGVIDEMSAHLRKLEEQARQNPDDLEQIIGIGPKLKKRLRDEFQITTFRELATLTAESMQKLSAMLLFPDRIYREDWIGQARELHLRKYNELLPPNEAEATARLAAVGQ